MRVSFLKYTDKRAKIFKKLMKSIPVRRRDTEIILDGNNNFKFIFMGRSIEVSLYDNEIIIRKFEV